jgi:hypothetical protein
VRRRLTPAAFLQTAGAPATCGAARTRARTGAPGRASSAAASAAACRRARPATRRPAASATRTGPRTATGPSARERAAPVVVVAGVRGAPRQKAPCVFVCTMIHGLFVVAVLCCFFVVLGSFF